MTDPKKVADLVAKLDRFLSGNFYAPPVIREALEASSKTLETLSSELERVKGERDEARLLVAEANNSLYGSQGYFHSLNGGPFDKYHLATGIEKVKANARSEWRRAERAEASLGVAAKALEPFNMLLAADDIWTDYGSGFRVHFSFEPGRDMSVVEKVLTARSLASIQTPEK
jgi:hypothetical protein